MVQVPDKKPDVSRVLNLASDRDFCRSPYFPMQYYSCTFGGGAFLFRSGYRVLQSTLYRVGIAILAPTDIGHFWILSLIICLTSRSIPSIGFASGQGKSKEWKTKTEKKADSRPGGERDDDQFEQGVHLLIGTVGWQLVLQVE